MNRSPLKIMKQPKDAWKVAILGGCGTFHDQAASEFFKNEKFNIVPSKTFQDIAANVSTGRAQCGIMAVENSIVGSIVENYQILRAKGLVIVDEITMRINQNLMALPNTPISRLQEVHSHPMALKQCAHFFAKYPHIKLVEAADTALVAKQISEEGIMYIGAVGSELAAQNYGLDILASKIESYNANYTRFLVLQPTSPDDEKRDLTPFNKATIVFTLSNEVGSLNKILTMLTRFGANILKLQSIPIPHSPWTCLFIMDFTVIEGAVFHKLFEALREVTFEFSVLGVYHRGICVDD